MPESKHDRTPVMCAQAQLDAYNARDIDAFASVYADDVVLVDLATGVAFVNGKDELYARYHALFAGHHDLHCSLTSRIDCPPFVIDEEHVTGMAPGVTVHAVATYECRNGLIQRAWFLRQELSS